MYFVIFLLFQLSSSVLTSYSDEFTEELLIKPLYSDQVYVHFQFATKWHTDPSTQTYQHTRLFPRALGEIIQRYHVKELHISLTGGLWRHEFWGYPIVDAAPGTEIWAWFHETLPIDLIDNNWKELSGTLSGLLCASLNFVDKSNSISPEFSLRPRGVVEDHRKINHTYLRYASLPREIVCTENLTPWKKLLPCDSKAGLASLLNSGYIHNTRYHSIALHLRPICRDNNDCQYQSLELQQSVSLVYDYKILGTRNWSFRKLFGQGLMGHCPLAKQSTIYVDTTSNGSVPFQLIPSPDDYLISLRGGNINTFAKYNIKPYAMTINANYLSKTNNVIVNSPPAIHANQYVTGYGQERGGIVTKIYNNHWSDLDCIVLQNIPWYVPVYLHTLKIRNTDGNGNNQQYLEPLEIRYIPGRQRERPYYLEILLTLPKKSITTISIDFDYVFLKWQEYPPDANHGFYIGSALITANLPLARNFTGIPQDGTCIVDSFNASRSGYFIQIRTENLVITLPTPDFSMPYNVICLACTVVALAFGPLHNITTKRLILTVKDNETLIVKIKKKISLIFKTNSNNDNNTVQ